MIFKPHIVILLIYLAGSSVLINGCKGQGRQAKATGVGLVNSVATENTAVNIRLPDYFNGYNAQMLRGPTWQAPGFIDQVKGLYPGLIRYPGGTVTSYWDWKTGWLKQDLPMRKEWGGIKEKNPVKLEDLKFACNNTGAKPLFVLNMMTSNLEYQVEMLEYAEKIGLKVEFVELENELYLGEKFYVDKYPTGKDYATDANNWITTIKQKFPGVRIAVVGSSLKEGDARRNKPHAQRTSNWNRDVLSVIKNADAMTFHVYGGTGLNYLGPLPDNDDEAAGSETGNKADAYQTVFDKNESIPYVLSIPFIRWKSTEAYDYRILPAGMKVWVTEYNLFEREGVVAGTWAHGLYALMQTLLFLESPKTELVCYHNLSTNAQFAAIFFNDNSFFKSVKKKPTKEFGYSAAGHCLALAGKAMDGGGEAVKLNFSNNTQITAARGKDYPALNGWIIKKGNRKNIIVTNLSNSTVKTDFSKLVTGNVSYTQLNAEPHTQVGNEHDLKKQTGNGTSINLNPHSVTLIEGD